MTGPLIRKVDGVQLPVPDLDEALAFYRDGLGHELVWRDDAAVGLRLPDTDAELVLQTERPHPEVDFEVPDADRAALDFERAGGTILHGPFDIRIGRCVVVSDPWGNVLVLLDARRGPLATDGEGRVIDVDHSK